MKRAQKIVVPPMPDPKARVLVIKHSAFGDVILALGPMKAIRLAHPEGRITLLTTKPYAGLLEQSGLFDEIWIDESSQYHPTVQNVSQSTNWADPVAAAAG